MYYYTLAPSILKKIYLLRLRRSPDKGQKDGKMPFSRRIVILRLIGPFARTTFCHYPHTGPIP